MLTRKPSMLVRIALANKMMRIVWALMARGGASRVSVARTSARMRARSRLPQ
jgi:transposase